MISVKIKGVKELQRALRKVGEIPPQGWANGLLKAGLMLQRASQQIVPVDTGNLKNSAFTRMSGVGWSAAANVGYTANYAIYVHENLNSYHRPPTRAKFLEEPARVLDQEILRIIAETAAIK